MSAASELTRRTSVRKDLTLKGRTRSGPLRSLSHTPAARGFAEQSNASVVCTFSHATLSVEPISFRAGQSVFCILASGYVAIASESLHSARGRDLLLNRRCNLRFAPSKFRVTYFNAQYCAVLRRTASQFRNRTSVLSSDHLIIRNPSDLSLSFTFSTRERNAG